MALDQPFAPGPNALTNPIPGESQGNAPVPSVARGPAAAQGQPMPSAPAPSAQPNPPQASPDDALLKELNGTDPGLLDELNQGPPKAGTDPNDFTGKKVEGTFMGMKARVTAGGDAQFYSPRFDKWMSFSENGAGDIWKKVAHGIYSAVESIPETAASVAANLIPGEGAIPGAGRAIGAGVAAGVGRASGLSEYVVSHLYNPKDFYILKKIAGVTGEPGAVASALLTGGAQGVMEAVGGVASRMSDKATQASQVDKSVLNVLQQGKALESAAQEAGIPIRPTQAVAQLPGGSDAARMESGMATGQYGAASQAHIELANQNQLQQIGSAVDGLVKKVAPDVDFENMDISKISGAGSQRLNFADRIEQKMNQQMSANRAAVQELAKDRQFSATPIVDSFESNIKKLASFNKGLIKSDGSIDINAFLDVAKQEGYSDKSISAFARSYVSLKNAVKRDAPALSQELASSAPTSTFPQGQVSPAATQVQPPLPGPIGASGVRTDVGGQPSLPGTSVQIPPSEALIPRGKAGEAVAGLKFSDLSAFTTSA